MARENFPADVVSSLRKRAGERCSNPGCVKPTSGPRTEVAKSISIGVAAHIRAASQGGPRYQPHMSSRERKSIDNAIWLCQNCAKLIDSDTILYTPPALLGWKEQSEARALREISETSITSSEGLSLGVAPLRNREIITLGDNNSFAGNAEDLKNLATRCAIAATEGARVEFEVRLSPTVLESQPQDPLFLPKYEKARAEKANQLSSWLSILTAPSAHEWWQYSLHTVDEWTLAIGALLERSSIVWHGGSGHKLDVWRTEEPEIIAAVYLDPDELQRALQHMGLESTQHLRFGPYWKAAIDLPPDLIARHVIPRIVTEIVRHKISPEGSVLNLLEWHIGEG